MNQFFSFDRFRLLVLKHWAENKYRYSLSVLAYFGLLIVWFLFHMFVIEDDLFQQEFQQVTFFFTLLVVSTFYASQYFNDLASRAKGINFLLLPASAFEKFLCSILYVVILFFVVFTVAFYLADIIIISVANTYFLLGETTAKATVTNIFEAKLTWTTETGVNMVLFYFSIQSLFLLGSIHFRKFSFVKTIITGLVVYLILFSLAFFFYRRFVPGGDRPDGPAQIPEWILQVICILIYVIAPISWILTYYRLKQKQV